jgi:hypothetical protein
LKVELLAVKMVAKKDQYLVEKKAGMMVVLLAVMKESN